MVLESLLSGVLNRFLAAYVENLNTSNLNANVWSGDVKLRNLKLKRGALDKFRLPVDVRQGHIGELTLKIPWSNLRGQPVQVQVDDVFLLAIPSSDPKYDPVEDEEREQQLKQERLESAEMLSARPAAGLSEEEQQKNESFTASLVNRIVDNLQITVSNVHVRFEDKLSVPGHPFSIGLTLSEFTAISTDEFWNAAYIHNAANGIHKLAKLSSLAIYFNCDDPSIFKEDDGDMQQFADLISTEEHIPDHQFILRPVSGTGKLIINQHPSNTVPKIDGEVLFKELGFIVSEDQYKSLLSMVDLFHFYTRQHQYKSLRPAPEEFEESKPKALLKFATTAVLHEVHERHRQWTWDYFKERRDDRIHYVDLFKNSVKNNANFPPQDKEALQELERKLGYKDIRFYRSIARSELRKERASEPPSQKQESQNTNSGGWLSWIWGSWTQGSGDDSQRDDTLNPKAREELYEAIDWDENDASPTIDLPSDTIKLRISGKLGQGSFTLRRSKEHIRQLPSDQHDILAASFNDFSADVSQRVENFTAAVALAAMQVDDGTQAGTQHRQIVRVLEKDASRRRTGNGTSDEDDKEEEGEAAPFFRLEIDHKPLDKHADLAALVQLRPLEVIYHPAYVEQVVAFFKPPATYMESVNALIDVASETLEGIRKDTRAGLEYALEKHRSIDLRVAVDAPIIVIPENVTVTTCSHIVLDAGHLSVQTQGADKEALAGVRSKQNQVYSDEDYRRLESLMYDKFFVSFSSVQLLMGESYGQCMSALNSDDDLGMHLVEKINIAFIAEISIMPKAPNLTKFRISGELPELNVNFSDKKYKTLMRMIDVAIPKFHDEGDTLGVEEYSRPMGFQQRSKDDQDVVEVHDHELTDPESDSKDDDDDDQAAIFFDAETQSSSAYITAQLRQKNFELSFKVDKLQTFIYKSAPENGQADTLLANTVFEGFRIALAVRQKDLSVDVFLKSLYVEDRMTDADSHFKHLITSKNEEYSQGKNNASKDLVKITYTKCQPDSPDYYEKFDGVDQIIDVQLSTINLVLTRASILVLYDFIMLTFVPQSGEPSQDQTDAKPVSKSDKDGDSIKEELNFQELEKLRIKIKLESIVLILNDDGERLATLSLSSADILLLLRGPTMRLNGRLGSLGLIDDVEDVGAIPDYKRLLTIQGEEVADFIYETYDRHISQPYPGYDSYVYLRTGSLQLTFVEKTVHRLLLFFSKFAKMKAIYDAATEVAADIQAPSGRMQYDVVIKTPIVIFTRATDDPSKIVANLGEISAANSFEPVDSGTLVKTTAGLQSIRLSSEFKMGYDNDEVYSIRVLNDVNLTFDICQMDEVDRAKDKDIPTTRVTSHLSDVKISLTEEQYQFFIALSQMIPRAFMLPSDDVSGIQESVNQLPFGRNAVEPTAHTEPVEVENGTSDLFPELAPVAHDKSGTSVSLYSDLEVVFTAGSLSIDLYKVGAKSQKNLKDHSLARFSLVSPSLKFRMLSNQSMEAEILLKTVNFVDTRRTKTTKWREIIPATKSNGHQFMANFSMSSGSPSSAVANVTVDAPNLIFSLDPFSELGAYFLSAFPSNPQTSQDSRAVAPKTSKTSDGQSNSQEEKSMTLAFRANVSNAKIIMLANPERYDTEAMILVVDRVQLAQQGTFVASVEKLGMSLCRMDHEEDSVQILDKLDSTFSQHDADNEQQATTIDLDVQRIVLRLSYRDAMLINSIVGGAVELSSQVSADRNQTLQKDEQFVSAHELQLQAATRARADSRALPPPESIQAEAMVRQETFRATFEGFQVVLVGDVHELPLIDLHAPKFSAKATNWSSDLKAGATLTPAINYYNLKNSHWEPLIDPWEFSVKATRNTSPESSSINVSSRRRLEVNMTAAFIEIAMAQMLVWDSKEQNFRMNRGESAPFRMYNRSGHNIRIVSDSKHSGVVTNSVAISDGEEVPWRFDDWRTMRETLTSGSNLIKIEFEDSHWNSLRNVSVDREGVTVHTLSPKVNQVSHRLLCDISLKNNIKVVTLRSTFNVENYTLLPIEMVIVDANGKKATDISKIAPGSDSPVPIEFAYHNRIKVRPDPGFNYAWPSDSYHWKDLIKRPARTISCRSNSDEPPFRFQAFTVHSRADPLTRVYPNLTLRVRAPIEIENLLPYDIQFRIFDKNREHNWSTFLRHGGTSPIHIAELSHLLLLSVDIQDTVFKRSEFAIINTDNPEDLPVENGMILVDQDELELRLQLNYIKYPDSGGAFKVQIFCPYTIINKVGLDIGVRTKPWMASPKNAAGQQLLTRQAHQREPLPFLFSYATVDHRNRAMLRVGGSAWSKALSFEAVGTLSEVSIPSNDNRGNEAAIGIDVSEGLGHYKLTKVITIYPRFVVHNEFSESIRVRTVASTEITALKPHETLPLHWINSQSSRHLVTSLDGVNSTWSAPLNMQDIGRVHLKLRAQDGSEILARVDVALQKATIFVRFTRETSEYPYLIRNENDFAVNIAQSDLIENSPEGIRQTRQGYKVQPHEVLPYAWDYPSASDKMLKLTVDGSTREINAMEIGSLKPFHVRGRNGTKDVSIDIRAKGKAQEIVLSHFVEERSVYQVQRSPGSISRESSSTSVKDIDFVEKETDIQTTFSLQLSFEGVGLSIINSRMDELAYASFRGLDMKYNDSALNQSVDLSLKWIQIDNQLYGGIFPILLYPTVIPRDSKELDTHPNLQASVILLKDQAHGVMHFKYASVLLQEMTIELDEDFLFAVMDFSKLTGQNDQANTKNQLTDEPARMVEPDYETEAGDVYFEILHLQPLQVDISFMRTETLNSDQKIFETNNNPLAFFLNAVTMTLGNVNDAPVRLNGLVLENTRSSIDVLRERITFHYNQEFFSQLYRVLGSADFLGNPVGLFSNVSSGVADMFYEPLSGFIVHGNRELGIGIARGAGSFVRKTVFGVSDSFSKFTGSIGKGLSAATLDREYQSKRRMKQHRNRPKHALYGVTAGANSFVTSVASGFEGLALRPIEGAEAGGTSGFFRGVGKGLVGAVTKPAVGVFDMASNVTEGIRNTTTVFEQNAIDRVRFPRFIALDEVLRPYQEREALGQMWLKTCENGKYFNEKYACHVDVSSDGDEIIVILTEKRILLLKSVKLKIGWDVPLSDLATINLERSGISLILRGGVNGPFLALSDQSTRLWFFRNVEKVVTEYNQQKALSV